MHLTIIIDESDSDYLKDTGGYDDPVISHHTLIHTLDSGEEAVVYTKLEVDYGDGMPTWINNLDRTINALEKHYGYTFDMKKYIKHCKRKVGDLFTEDPDH